MNQPASVLGARVSRPHPSFGGRDARAPKPILQTLRRIPAGALLLLIRIYQRTLSPALPVITLGHCVCRFAPTCSHYAVEAIQTHGALRGGLLALRRLVRCTPLHPGGFDPVPVPPHRRACHAVVHGDAASASPLSLSD